MVGNYQKLFLADPDRLIESVFEVGTLVCIFACRRFLFGYVCEARIEKPQMDTDLHGFERFVVPPLGP